MKRAFGSFLLTQVVLVSLVGTSARAEESVTSDEPNLRAGREVTRFLPTTSSAVVATSAGLTSVAGGYEGAAGTPVLSVGTELRVVRRVALIAGIAYTSSGAAASELRPQIGARVQVLDQAAAGIDASAAFVFRKDRFTSEDGLFQGTIALGRSFGDTLAVMNIVYGQDGEGDDHEGEIRLACLRPVWGGLHVGLEGRYLHAIDSTDPHRAAQGTPSMEAMAGPLVAYTVGRWALIAEAGVAARRTSRLDTGLATIAGVGTAF
jgi:hypothetical protein